RYLHDRAKQLRIRLVGACDPGRDGGAKRLVAQAVPPTFAAIRCSTLFSWNGVSSGCFESTSAQIPERWGVAKLFPDALIVDPFVHASSTSTPRAKNSTGGFGL